MVDVQLKILLDRIISGEDDLLAINAFACLIKENPMISSMATKRIAAKMNSINNREIMQTLHALEECMVMCGDEFHNEVGKFRFLNELIRLVSPKHLGTLTPKDIRDKILDLLLMWTVQYPKETKIKEAYDMLIKQGVVHEIPKNIIIPPPSSSSSSSSSAASAGQSNNRCPAIKSNNNNNSGLEKSKSDVDEHEIRLKKLLQSTHALDVQAANLLIRNMVKENERRIECKIRLKSEIEKLQDNLNLLNEMLVQAEYNFQSSSEDELVTIEELYNTCRLLEVTIFNNTSGINDEPNVGIELASKLTKTFNKYTKIILKDDNPISKLNKSLTMSMNSAAANQQTAVKINEMPKSSPTLNSLLSASDDDDHHLHQHQNELLGTSTPNENFNCIDDICDFAGSINENQSSIHLDIHELKDIFSKSSAPSGVTAPAAAAAVKSTKSAIESADSPQFIDSFQKSVILQPTQIVKPTSTTIQPIPNYTPEDLILDDDLTEVLFKKNSTFQKQLQKTSLNELLKQQQLADQQQNQPQQQQQSTATTIGGAAGGGGNNSKIAFNSDIDSLISNLKSTLTNKNQLIDNSIKLTNDKIEMDTGDVIDNQHHDRQRDVDDEDDVDIIDKNDDDDNILKGGGGGAAAGGDLTKDTNDDLILDDVKTPEKITIETKELHKPLSELFVDINLIKPSAEPPRIIMDEPDGLKVTLNFSRDHPRPDISIIVITTINQNTNPINNYQLDASISKPCKLRLLKPSGDSLPGVKPFRPPTETITQLLLISNTNTQKPFNIMCIVSYCMDNDPDPFKESIEVKNLPYCI